MKLVECKSCGANEFTERDGYRVCVYCGTKYAEEKAQASIDLEGDVARLLRKCREDPAHAGRYANLILDIDPTNAEALRYLGYR